MIRRGRVKTVLSVLVGLWVTVLGLDGQADQGSIDSPGLVGGHFGSDDFSRLQSFSRVAGLSHEWTEADDYGQQWSAKWQGMIKGPALGAVIFRADTDQSVVLAIGVGAETVIDSGEGKVEERLSMQKGAWYPIMQLSTTDDYARSTRRGAQHYP